MTRASSHYNSSYRFILVFGARDRRMTQYGSFVFLLTFLLLGAGCSLLQPPPAPTILPAPLTPPAVVPASDPGSFLVTWTSTPEAAGYAISVRPMGSERFPPFRFVSAAQAGNVILSGFDPQTTYAVSIAALDQRGRLGLFSSPEIIVEPTS